MTTDKEQPPAPAGPIDVAEAILAHLTRTGELKRDTFLAYQEHITRFGAFLERGRGIMDMNDIEEDDVRSFLSARPSDGRALTVSLPETRFRAVRKFFDVARDLRLTRWNPTEGMETPPRSHDQHRPLLDDEVMLCRSYSLGTLSELRRPIAWALGEATATTHEIGVITVGDVDADGVRVWLHGSSTRDERWGLLTEWGRHQMARRLAMNPEADEQLVVWRTRPTAPRASSSQAILETLKAAHVYEPGVVNPRSLPAWAGRHAYDEGATIDAVALMLGMRSLDQTAAFIGFNWREN
jgi:integrase/recombinase XerC